MVNPLTAATKQIVILAEECICNFIGLIYPDLSAMKNIHSHLQIIVGGNHVTIPVTVNIIIMYAAMFTLFMTHIITPVRGHPAVGVEGGVLLGPLLRAFMVIVT
jgi:hypothetical protein